MTHISDHKAFRRHKNRYRKKAGRRRQIPGPGIILAGALIILALPASAAAFYFMVVNPAEETDTGAEQLVIAEDEEAEETSVSILDEESSELTITWDTEIPDALTDYYSVIENTIAWSSNEDYYTLIDHFGKDAFNSWTAGLGSPDIALNVGSFGELTCRSFTRIWEDIYEYFMSGDEAAGTLSSFFIGTENSCIYETLGSQYTVYSKAGWYFEGNDSYYTVQNDAGIVMKEDHPYIITILSNAYEQFGLLDPLVAAVDQAHTELLEQEV